MPGFRLLGGLDVHKAELQKKLCLELSPPNAVFLEAVVICTLVGPTGTTVVATLVGVLGFPLDGGS